MGFVIFAALFIPAALASIFKHETMTERWLVKTVCDCDSSGLVSGIPIHSSIEEQTALARPTVDAATTRLNSERQLFAFNAYLIGAKRETDGDYHLVIRSPYSRVTMIAEIPNPDEPGAPVVFPFRSQYTLARMAVDSLLGGAPERHMHRLEHPAKIHIEGIGFFDEVHLIPQEGSAPNARELHPVLLVRPIQ